MAGVASAVVGIVKDPGKLLGGIASVINAIRGKDPAAAAELEKIVAEHEHAFRMAELQQENEALKADVATAQMQTDVNKLDAASPRFWQAGWRPYIGWICGSGLAFQFILRPLLIWGAKLGGIDAAPPELDMGDLITLLLGMLGLGGMRTFEKVRTKQ